MCSNATAAAAHIRERRLPALDADARDLSERRTLEAMSDVNRGRFEGRT
jgi:hypothetical protein